MPHAPSQDLDVYLEGIRAHDESSFACWLAAAEHPLRLSLRSMATRVDVEAVLQETLLRVWQLAPRLEPDGRANGLVRLAHRIARNLAIDELRRARGEPADLDRLDRLLAAAADAPVAAPDPLLKARIADCTEKVTGQPARVLRARLLDDGSYDDAELAEQMGMRRNTFLQNLSRARRSVADCLERHGVELSQLGVAGAAP